MHIIFLPLIVLALSITSYSFTDVEENKNTPFGPELTLEQKHSDKAKEESIIDFNYKDEELVDIINFLATQKGVNIILPAGSQAIKLKVNTHADSLLTLDQAWNRLQKLLDISGYTLLPRDQSSVILPKSKTISKEAIPLFVGMSPEQLPDTDERIRYLYYLSNLKVADSSDNEIMSILKEFLPDTAKFNIDTTSNALLITEKSSDIKSVMKIIIAIDETTSREVFEILKLEYVSAETIAQLFNENLLKTEKESRRYRVKEKKISDMNYFSENVKIISEQRTNSLIIIGKDQAINRIKDFIIKYLDVEIESGKSILHVYQLLYLDAPSFAPVLQDIVDSKKGNGPQQASASGQGGGLNRFFEGVIIQADQEGESESKRSGSNKLIIAAKNDDWKYIASLIEQLDKPQPQVIIEILIADLTLEDTRQLGSLARNPDAIPMPAGVNVQAANLGQAVLDHNPAELGDSLNSDVLARTVGPDKSQSLAELGSFGQAGEPGSMVVALNDKDGKSWSILQLLQAFGHTKILSHPYVVSTNNKEAVVSIGEERLLRDVATASAGATTITRKTISANLTVTITPRISATDNVNLQVSIDISEYKSAIEGEDTRITRFIETNANIQNSAILVLGGLMKENTTEGINETPILSKIPILGWFFKRKRVEYQKTSLTIFISPTVIQPRLRGGINEYTQDYVSLTKRYSEEGQLFDSLRDPVTRFFFRADTGAADDLDSFVEQSKSKIAGAYEPGEEKDKPEHVTQAYAKQDSTASPD